MPDAVGSILNDPITKHLRPEATRLKRGSTVAQTLDSLRTNPPAGRVVYFYVVDGDDRLCGVLPTRRLLLSPPETPIETIMVKGVRAVPHTATVLEACEFFTLYKLLAFPVVDAEKRILGLVDVELYTGELEDLERRENNDDLFQLVGVHLTAAEHKSVNAAVRKRFPWLLCNIGGGLLAALLADLYDDVATMAAVVPFIPVTLALAESVAIQSVSLAIQRLHGERPTWRTLLPNVAREGLVGMSLGLLCGALVGLIAMGWKGMFALGLSLCGGIFCGVTCAAAFGLAMPFVLKLWKRDPSLASGPIALAIADMLTLLAYFNLAGWMLR